MPTVNGTIMAALMPWVPLGKPISSGVNSTRVLPSDSVEYVACVRMTLPERLCDSS